MAPPSGLLINSGCFGREEGGSDTLTSATVGRIHLLLFVTFLETFLRLTIGVIDQVPDVFSDRVLLNS